eukprot:1275-Eustigmatos_ZCMA.PRE.1
MVPEPGARGGSVRLHGQTPRVSAVDRVDVTPLIPCISIAATSVIPQLKLVLSAQGHHEELFATTVRKIEAVAE